MASGTTDGTFAEGMIDPRAVIVRSANMSLLSGLLLASTSSPSGPSSNLYF